MISNSRVRLALISTGVAALLLSSSVVASAATISGSYNAAAAKLVPASLKGMTLAAATDSTYPPDESMKGSTMQGFNIDLIKAIAKTLGVKISESSVTFDNIIPGIQSGRYQIGNSSFTDNKLREKLVNFVDYFQAGEGVYAAANSKLVFNGFKSFCGLTIAVEKGTYEQSDAKDYSKKCPAGKKIGILAFDTQTEANSAVSSGHASMGFLDSQVAGYLVAHTGGKFKLLGSAVNVAPYGIATAKTPTGLALAKAIKAALLVLVANGTLNAIFTKWGVQSGAIPVSKMVLNGAIL